MLNRIHIQNYAIIEELSVDFSSGLNIITGETGAGKSILMGALSLTLGERADSAALLQKDKKCVVEVFFSTIKNRSVKQFLLSNDLDADEELVIRREIAPNGKSRAFVNDTPVNLNQLKELSSLMVDLHQQFDTLELGDSDFQRQVLDALAGNAELLQQYSTIYHQYILIKKQLEELQSQQSNANKELDYNRFLFDELSEADLKENELEDLDAELKLLSNVENIKQQLDVIYFELKESEQPIVQQLKVLNNKLHALEQYHPGIAALFQRMQAMQIELNDISDEIEHINSGVAYSLERIQWVNERISLGYKLLKKHNASTTNELLLIRNDLEKKLNMLFSLSDIIGQKEKEANDLLKQCQRSAEAISVNRNKAIKPFAEKVNVLLAQVGMPNAKIKVQLTDVVLNQYGSNTIDFLFDANKSNRFEPLRKVASGGELSRLMLCIKSLVAKKMQLPVLIFDEIDTGISGEAARQVGIIMKDLSSSHQVLSITHQPQIAAKADAHYFVYKDIKADKIVTSIRLLNNDERITTIAKMLSGEKPTAAALQNAREMVGN